MLATVAGVAGAATLIFARQRGKRLEEERVRAWGEREQQHLVKVRALEAELATKSMEFTSAALEAEPKRHSVVVGIMNNWTNETDLEIAQQNVTTACVLAGTVITIISGCYVVTATLVSRNLVRVRKQSWPIILQQRKKHEAEVARFGGASLARSLLPHLESLEADAAVSAQHRTALSDALSSHGLCRFEPSVGAPFDAELMAIADEAEEYDVSDSLIVRAVVRHGYTLYGERSVRPAEVLVDVAEESPEP